MRTKILSHAFLILSIFTLPDCTKCGEEVQKIRQEVNQNVEKEMIEDEDFKKNFEAAATTAEFVISGKYIKYKGRLLRMADHVDNWIQILGKPSRQRITNYRGDSSSRYVWDDLGILCGVIEKSSQVSEVTIAFRKGGQFPSEYYAFDESKDPEFWPRNTYSSSILIDGAVINQDTPIKYFNYNKKREKFSRDHLKSLYSTDELEVPTSPRECSESYMGYYMNIDFIKAYMRYYINVDFKGRVYSFTIGYECRVTGKNE